MTLPGGRNVLFCAVCAVLALMAAFGVLTALGTLA